MYNIIRIDDLHGHEVVSTCDDYLEAQWEVNEYRLGDPAAEYYAEESDYLDEEA